jgi:hypothetical protein
VLNTDSTANFDNLPPEIQAMYKKAEQYANTSKKKLKIKSKPRPKSNSKSKPKPRPKKLKKLKDDSELVKIEPLIKEMKKKMRNKRRRRYKSKPKPKIAQQINGLPSARTAPVIKKHKICKSVGGSKRRKLRVKKHPKCKRVLRRARSKITRLRNATEKESESGASFIIPGNKGKFE